MITDMNCVQCKKEFLGMVPEGQREEYFKKREGLCASCRETNEIKGVIKWTGIYVFVGALAVTFAIEFKEPIESEFDVFHSFLMNWFENLPSFVQTFMQVGVVAVSLFIFLCFIFTAIIS